MPVALDFPQTCYLVALSFIFQIFLKKIKYSMMQKKTNLSLCGKLVKYEVMRR